ncbi:MAG: LacI family DNA-binding transcriptional regulator [Halanaerobiales bacterium]
MKKTTIKDVAQKADVSPSTVSRVISDSPNISDSTKHRVRKIMEEMNYHPNAIARSLVTQKTNTIGLVMARPTDRAFANPFFSEVIRGIADIAQSKHYNLLFSAAENYYTESEETLSLVKNGRVDGLILMASRANDKLIEYLQSYRYPFVLIGRSPHYDNLPRVDNDNIKAAYDMMNFLIKNNNKKIALIAGPDDYIVSRDRIEGYKNALKESNIKFDENLIKYTDFSYKEGYKAVKELLRSIPDLDVIFAIDDLLAIAALNSIKEHGLNIPRDVGVVGFNDQTLSSYIEPNLTTVRIPIIEMGKKAATMLIKMINNPEYNGEEKIIPTKIIARKTHKN